MIIVVTIPVMMTLGILIIFGNNPQDHFLVMAEIGVEEGHVGPRHPVIISFEDLKKD